MSDVFRFRQFAVHHRRSAWPVGTDSVLLGAWTQVPHGPVAVLDIGCGSGVLSLMIAQKNTNARITAVDIDEDSVEEARRNVRNAALEDRITVVQTDIRRFSEPGTGVNYDLVISNPPYFESGLYSGDQRKQIARHGFNFHAVDLPEVASRLMAKDGLISLVVPFSQTEQLVDMANEHGVFVQRRCDVHHDAGQSSPGLSLIVLGRQLLRPELMTLTLYDAHGRPSEAYRKLTEDYLLYRDH